MGRFRNKYFRGALDIIFVEQRNGTFKSSGWYLHYSSGCKIKKTSVVEIVINNKVVDFRITYGQFGKDEYGVPTYPRDFDKLGPIIAELREGKNDIIFRIEGRKDLMPVEAHIFRWKWDSQIVVVDVDGTMTKSEIRGLICCFANVKYLHEGVASMFSAIESYGYQLMYLTARPISWIKNTRCYISDHGDQKNRRIKLPIGPVITSCHGVFPTFWRYFKQSSHAAFKTPCLREIKGLFPCDTKPLYAGFGDKKSDLRSYEAVGISEELRFYVKVSLIRKRTIIILYEDGEEFIKFSGGYAALERCLRMFPPRKPSGYDRVNQDEGSLREEDLELIRTTFPRVTELRRESDSHRGEPDVGGNGSANLRHRPRQT